MRYPSMLNKKNNQSLARDLEDFGLPKLPDQVVDSHQMLMDVSGAVWRFNTPSHITTFDFDNRKIENKWLMYSLKRHLIYCIQRVSPLESYNTIRLNTLYMSNCVAWNELNSAQTVEEHADAVNKVMSEVLETLRRDGILYNFARIRAWYRWCVDYLPELGFDADEAYKWELVRVPGNEKGVAVRTEDPDGGPLNDAELILLRKALQEDQSIEPEHVKQRAAIWLALVYGRNPANFVQLRMSDLAQVEGIEPDEIWTLNIPRIKKRTRPRSEFKNEYVDPSLLKVLRDLIKFGHEKDVTAGSDRPLFVRQSPRAVSDQMAEWAWHMTSTEFTLLIQHAVSRYGINSPRTGLPLEVTTRRLRYTFATNRVREGISAHDLAEALDHTDLQHVRVYFDTKSTIVERLDRAAATEIAPKLRLFKGTIVSNGNEAINGNDQSKRIRIVPELITSDHHVNDLGVCGKKEFCNLFPPYSCYPCDRFQPFSDSQEVHERVFDFLIDRRERLRSDPLESTRIAVQLDEVIYACAEVVKNLQARSSANGAS